MKAIALLSPDVEHTDENILVAMSKLSYPVLATVKKDGIRALRLQDIPLASQRFKWIPNSSLCGRAIDLPVGFDMELWNPSLDYNTIQSIVMSEEHERSDEIQFHVLDNFALEGYTYINRCHDIARDIIFLNYPDTNPFTFPQVYFDFPYQCDTPEQLFQQFLQFEKEGHEGICFRTPSSLYKQGRSTLNEQYLVKFCRYSFFEGVIVGFKEQIFNDAPENRNEIGMMERSKKIEFRQGKNTLGAFIILLDNGDTLDVGNGIGMTNEFRLNVWLNQSLWLGKRIKIRSKGHGVKDKPRCPVYWGERDDSI